MSSRRKFTQNRSAILLVEPLIHALRGQKVILDEDLARLYGVSTKVLNQAVKRNRKKFPKDFVFHLTKNEAKRMGCWRPRKTTARADAMRSQNVTASKRNVRHLSYAFIEHGAIMAANVLRSPLATQMSVFVVRAFIKMRSFLTNTKDLAEKLIELERKITDRLDIHEVTIVNILKRIMELLDPPPPPPEPPKRPIGFHAKDR